jgi:hypothetical protein
MEQFQQVAVTLVLVHKVGDGTIHDGSSMSTSTVFVTGLSIDSTDLHARAKGSRVQELGKASVLNP